jgi:hypothetical protein
MEQAEQRLRDWEDLQSHTMKELALAKSEEAMMAVEKAAQGKALLFVLERVCVRVCVN